MNINLLIEAPLPDNWDKSQFKSNVPFDQRVEYAVERARDLGWGSSRVAVEIEYQGRMTALKIALNNKGLAQNEVEIKMLKSPIVISSGICIPMIDYDTDNDRPVWIHTELADIDKRLYIHYELGVSKANLDQYIHTAIRTNAVQAGRELIEKSPRANVEMIRNLSRVLGIHPDLVNFDITRNANWGWYKGNPVLIDIGGATSLIKALYLNQKEDSQLQTNEKVD